MSSARRRAELGAFLQAFRPLWHGQPFREARPAWCATWPVLADQLPRLSDAESERLNDDSAAAIALLARHAPALADLPALADVPPCRSAGRMPESLAWAWEIPGRKRRQIESFAGAARASGRPVVDWCGGKGHLGRLLALAWEVPVDTLEIDPALCAEGERLARRLSATQHFRAADALSVADSPAVGQHAVALHACGDLHRRLIVHGAARGVGAFDIAPCCYHRGIADDYRPLHGDGGLCLSRDDTRLAVTETVTASPRLRRQRDREMAWKLAFAAWREQATGAEYKSFKPVPAAWFRGGFGEFMQALAAREGLPPPARPDGLEAEGWRRQREVMRLSIARHAFRRALEVWLVLDAAAYLEHRGYAVEVGVFCERRLTPRNLLVSARAH